MQDSASNVPVSRWSSGLTYFGALSFVNIVPFTLALWPVWHWYWERLTDRSDEPLGLVALITFCILFLLKSGHRALLIVPSAAVTIMLGFYGVFLLFAPKLVLAILAVFAIGLFLSGSKIKAVLQIGDWALLLLSLPMVSTLDFFVGYPLRLLVCNLAMPLLRINGFAVTIIGASLIYQGQAIDIDAPCSGIRMLWASLYLASTLASLRRLNILRSVLLLLLALFAAVLANVLRVTALFYLEAGLVSLPDSWEHAVHEGVGVTVFLFVAIGLMLASSRLSLDGKTSIDNDNIIDNENKNDARKAFESLGPLPGTPGTAGNAGFAGPSDFLSKSFCTPKQMAFYLVCAGCAVMPLFPLSHPEKTRPISIAPKEGWPSDFAGKPLRPLALSARSAELAAAFPGEIKTFTAGNTTLIYRFIAQATKQLHPAADCYRAGGYEITYLPVYRDAQGLYWGAAEAKKGAENLDIHERIFDNRGNSWTDISKWYWAALLGRSTGPWWSIVEVAPSVKQSKLSH